MDDFHFLTVNNKRKVEIYSLQCRTKMGHTFYIGVGVLVTHLSRYQVDPGMYSELLSDPLIVGTGGTELSGPGLD